MNDKQFDVLQSCLSPVVSDTDDQVMLLLHISILKTLLNSNEKAKNLFTTGKENLK